MRDAGLLESAVHRPVGSMFGQEAYADLFDKAAALLQSLAVNHPFVDGNKRTAWMSCVVFLAHERGPAAPATSMRPSAWSSLWRPATWMRSRPSPRRCGTWPSSRCDLSPIPAVPRLVPRVDTTGPPVGWPGCHASPPDAPSPRAARPPHPETVTTTAATATSPPPLARLPRPRPLGYRQQAARLAAGGDGQVPPGAAA